MTVATDDHVMPGLDLFCADGSFLHLEEDWRRGLGWWLMDAEGTRRRVSIREALHLVPRGVAHEVYLEAERLVWQLEAEPSGTDSAARRDAIAELRREIDLVTAGPTSRRS